MSKIRFEQPQNKLVDFEYTKLGASKAREEPKRLNVFELDILYMHGDADGYTKDTCTYENTVEGEVALLEHCNFLRRCILEYPHGMGGDDGYWHIPMYSVYGDDYIPRDNPYCEGHATVESFGVIYIDYNAKEHTITLE